MGSGNDRKRRGTRHDLLNSSIAPDVTAAMLMERTMAKLDQVI